MTRPIVIIDNYDSFTYNIVHAAAVYQPNYFVFQNDQVAVEDIQRLNPSHIILGPGPKRPRDAGILMDCIAHFHQNTPLLGICLGHQAIGEFFGATLRKSPTVQHGKESLVQHTGTGLFQNIQTPMTVGRYHSLCLTDLPEELHAIAHSSDGVVQALEHRNLPIFGIQFHPESILSPNGPQIFQQFFSTRSKNAHLAAHSMFSTTL